MTDTATPRVGGPDEIAHADPANVRRAAWAGLVGTDARAYDFVIYGTASALIFSKVFFPNISPAAGIIAVVRRHTRSALPPARSVVCSSPTSARSTAANGCW